MPKVSIVILVYNIEKYIDSGEVVYEGQRCIYMVCDFIVGETVSQKIKREGNCSVYDIKRIISGVLNGLKYLFPSPPSMFIVPEPFLPCS